MGRDEQFKVHILGRIFSTAGAVLLLLATTSAASGTVPQSKQRLVDDFLLHNLSLWRYGQIYIARPYVQPVDEWTSGTMMQRRIVEDATEAFPTGSPAGDIVLVNYRADDPAAAYSAFKLILKNFDTDEIETKRLWRRALAPGNHCNSISCASISQLCRPIPR